jgi:hypothetical protein
VNDSAFPTSCSLCPSLQLAIIHHVPIVYRCLRSLLPPAMVESLAPLAAPAPPNPPSPPDWSFDSMPANMSRLCEERGSRCRIINDMVIYQEKILTSRNILLIEKISNDDILFSCYIYISSSSLSCRGASYFHRVHKLSSANALSHTQHSSA